MTKHRKRSRLLSILLTGVFLLIVVAYLGLPGLWQWQHAAAQVEAKKPHQVDTAEQPVDAELVERLHTTGDDTEFGPVILTYHDIGYNPNKYTVTPEAFAVQMRMLHDAGWVTLSSQQLIDWTQGAVLPRHSVLITFDDGAMGVWKYADPILKRYNMRASAYIITGFIDHIDYSPYYMTWGEVHELKASGRWDIEAHTHLGHTQVPRDAHGGTGPFLTTAKWLPDQNRNETEEEKNERARVDLVECQRQFVLHNLPPAKLFAYPFSAAEDEEAVTPLQLTVLSLYRLAMLDDSESTNMTSPADLERRMIRRMDTMADITPDRFVQKIEEATTS